MFSNLMTHDPLSRFLFMTLLAALIFLSPPQRVCAEIPDLSKSFQTDWVCVTDAAFEESFMRLADYRSRQGLATLVLTLDEVFMWSPAADDTTASLRWLSGVAFEQWGARYLLLGGDHSLLPAPMSRFVMGTVEWSYPLDSYYGCLEGDWNVDGDGWVAEAGDDLADPTPHLAVGRLPVETVAEAENIIDKIMAFEARVGDTDDDRLLMAATALDDTWQAWSDRPLLGVLFAEALRDTLMMTEPSLPITALYQSIEDWPHAYLLSPEIFADSLATTSHDFVSFICQGNDMAWSCGEYRHLDMTHFLTLAETADTFFIDLMYGEAARTDGEGILEGLLNLPNGGAIAARGPSGVTYAVPGRAFDDRFWQELFSDTHQRLGDAHVATLEFMLESDTPCGELCELSAFTATLLADPATYIRPQRPTAVPDIPSATALRALRAAPNPFNPATDISFELVGVDGEGIPVCVEVFDLRGRRIDLLLDETLVPGPQTVSWRGESSGMNSGVYFVRVVAAGQTATLKLTRLE